MRLFAWAVLIGVAGFAVGVGCARRGKRPFLPFLVLVGATSCWSVARNVEDKIVAIFLVLLGAYLWYGVYLLVWKFPVRRIRRD